MTWFSKFILGSILAVAAVVEAPCLTAQSADALFSKAQSDAQAQHKDVLLVFSASWCGPCKLFEKFLEDPQMGAITDRAFVVVRMDVGERANDPRHANTPGGEALRTALGAQADPGYPFLVMTDENGKPIANSYRDGKPDGNIGYPAAPEEIDWYVEMLRHVPAFSSADLAATHSWLQKHAPR